MFSHPSSHKDTFLLKANYFISLQLLILLTSSLTSLFLSHSRLTFLLLFWTSPSNHLPPPAFPCHISLILSGLLFTLTKAEGPIHSSSWAGPTFHNSMFCTHTSYWGICSTDSFAQDLLVFQYVQMCLCFCFLTVSWSKFYRPSVYTLSKNSQQQLNHNFSHAITVSMFYLHLNVNSLTYGGYLVLCHIFMWAKA